ncbi:hypothetical protein [Puerhibacterium puerhi]|uniref:hypothetical protein n=1 Tax=Puerhibacterium puerhi TaxID=2692623 RepID=UPI00135C4EDE|nr:hypothetical protein [Puerhibacterium puerhi]
MTQLDPDKVPLFPVVNIEVTETGEILVDGNPVPGVPGQAPTATAIAAVAEMVRAQRLDAVRVRARSPEGRFQMVVAADGQAIDTTPTTPATPRGGRRRPVLAAVVAASALGLVAATAAGVVALSDRPATTTAATASAPLPGAGANLPVLAPPGFAQKATWSLPADSRTTPLVSTDGSVVLLTAGRDLRTVDGDTGRVTWRGAGARDQLHLSQVDGRPVVATAGSQELSLWPLDLDGGGTVAATTLPIGARAEVTYLGSQPLVTLENQTVALLDGDGLTRRDVPVGATAVLAAPDGVVAVGADAWWLITPDAEPQRHPLPKPEAAAGAPAVLSAAADDQLLVAWPTTDPHADVLALIDTGQGAIRAQATIPAGAIRDDDQPLHDPTGQSLVLGSVLVDYGPHPVIAHLGELEATAVHGRTVYGTLERAAATATLTDGEVHTTTNDSGTTAVPPIAVTDDFAYVVTQKVDETYLYALPRTEGTHP